MFIFIKKIFRQHLGTIGVIIDLSILLEEKTFGIQFYIFGFFSVHSPIIGV